MSQPQISSAERIRDLSSISTTVPDLLASAGTALQALTGTVGTGNESAAANGDSGDMHMQSSEDRQDTSLQTAKEAFTANATSYFTTLQAIMARLRRQAYALEEAGIISAEAPGTALSATEQQQQARAGPTTTAAQRQAEEESRLINGGLGSLDVAYLNSRVGNGALEKEGELLREAKSMLEESIAQLKSERRGESGEEKMDEAP